MRAVVEWALLLLLCPVWIVGFTCYAVADWWDARKPRKPVKDGDR